MSDVARKRGRPVTYDDSQRAQFAELIRQHGARGTKVVLSAPICVETLLKIAREFGVPLQKGRRPRRAA
jgi:hypothetical protein